MRILIYDKTETRFVGKTWVFAAYIFSKIIKHFDHVYGATSWQDATSWLLLISANKQIDELQYWGHGVWGAPLLNKIRFNRNNWEDVRFCFHTGSLIWFRCCSVFGNLDGRTFAKETSNFFRCTIAANTFIIGPFHSGLHTIRPAEEPYWPATEGIKIVDAEPKSATSMIWSPNTIPCFCMKIPSGW